jgi:formate dehydrogenase accessory protein FdhD
LEREFVAGHLRYEGLIEDASQIRSLEIECQKAWAEIDPRSEKAPRSDTAADWTVRASLCRGESVLVTAEDVGRLNTLYEAFGWGFLGGLDLMSCYAVTTGRITSTTAEKVYRFGIHLVASKSAVTTLAVGMVERRGMTLVGFARQERMNVYVGRDGVTLD